MTANLHAIWLDDLAPGEGATTPIWDALYAEQDAETQRVVFNACADEHAEPVAVPTSFILIENKVSVSQVDAIKALAIDGDIESAAIAKALTTPKRKEPAKKPAAKKVSPRKKPGVLADAEAKLAGVAARVKAQTDGLGGAS